MKKIYSKLFPFAVASLSILVSCSDDESLSHTEVSPVRSLYAPTDDAFFNLESVSTVVFEWEAAKAEDNGVVLYDLVFDEETGDFSDPLYKVASDKNGFNRTATLSASTLNRIAEMAGVERGGVGRLKWTVLSSKGINVQNSEDSKIIEVKRFIAPDNLFFTGSATEGGEDLGNALMMKKIDDIIFEIHTALKPGEYYFATEQGGTPDTYYIEGGKLFADGKNTYEGEEKVYRITVNFATKDVEVTEIEAVSLWFAPTESFIHEIPYAGKGVWELEDAPVEFKQETWGRDERYKFRFTVNNGGESFEEWYGSTNEDNQRPGANEAASYWYMVPVSNDRWKNSFKFADAVDNNTSDIKVIFNNTVPQYTHTVTPN